MPSTSTDSSTSAVSSWRFWVRSVNSPVSYSNRPIDGIAYVRNNAKLSACW